MLSANPSSPNLRRAKTMAHALVDGFATLIRSGGLLPGQKLPTETEIMLSYGVSRTVVREALSKLQAAGLVETRHGIGTFVLEPRAEPVFGIDPAELATAADVLAVLELRISLETEAAGLAAVRRTEEQLAEMRAALDEFAARLADQKADQKAGSTDTVASDFRFHLAIASATGNRYFADIMSHVGSMLIPRARINSSRLGSEELSKYLARVMGEHEEVLDAIARHDPESARAAMRVHLTNSRERLRKAQEAAAAVAQEAAC